MQSRCTSWIKRHGIEEAPGGSTSLTLVGRDLLAFPTACPLCWMPLGLCLAPIRHVSHRTDTGLAESFQLPTLLQVSLRTVPTLAWMILPSLSHQPPFYSQDVSQMYENILSQPLRIPGGLTVAACDLLQALLHKDQRQRLGSKTDFVSDLPVEHWPLVGLSASCRGNPEAVTCIQLFSKTRHC